MRKWRVQIQLIEQTEIGDYLRHETRTKASDSEKNVRSLHAWLLRQVHRNAADVHDKVQDRPATTFEFLTDDKPVVKAQVELYGLIEHVTDAEVDNAKG